MMVLGLSFPSFLPKKTAKNKMVCCQDITTTHYMLLITLRSALVCLLSVLYVGFVLQATTTTNMSDEDGGKKITKSAKMIKSIRAVPSQHIAFDSKNIAKLGVKTNWRAANEEFEEIKKQHDGKKKPVKRVLWIRHGEGIHNAAEREVGKTQWENHEAKKEKYFDPSLNAVGEDQSKQLANAFQEAIRDQGLKIDAVFLSPLTRALETAKLALDSIWEEVPKISFEMARERHGKNICDKRRTRSELKTAWANVNFDDFLLSEEDPWFTERRETPDQVKDRVKIFLEMLFDHPYETIVVVGHSDYMSHAVEVAGFPPHWPANCEVVPMILAADE